MKEYKTYLMHTKMHQSKLDWELSKLLCKVSAFQQYAGCIRLDSCCAWWLSDYNIHI